MEDLIYETTPHPIYNDFPMDLYFAERVKEFVRDYGMVNFVETGVDKASTAITAAKICEKYIGIEIKADSCDLARRRFAENNINNAQIIQGNSPVVLLSLMHQIDVSKTIFFLDAHWGTYWPLLDEIDTISRGKGIIIFHDMVVPGYPELGFDSYGNQPLDYAYVKPALLRWSKNHRIEYNTKAAHVSPRGIGYVFPKW